MHDEMHRDMMRFEVALRQRPTGPQGRADVA